MKRLALALLFLCFATLAADAASRFGVCATTCTWDGSSTAMWSTTSGGATGQTPPGPADAVTFDGATCVGGTTCTITVNTNASVASITMGACTASTTGCVLDFSINNNNLTVGGIWNVSGGGVRVLKLGSGTFTINGGGVWEASTVTNFTLTAGTSNIVYSGATSGSRTWHGGGKTYATVTWDGNTGGGYITSNEVAGNTYGTLIINAPNEIYFRFSGTTQTITNQITWGGNPNSYVLITNDGASSVSPAIISSPANAALSYVGLYGITFSGAGTHAATNSFGFGGTTGITITGPTGLGGAGGTCILGGWLLWRDMPEHINDNFPAWLEKAA